LGGGPWGGLGGKSSSAGEVMALNTKCCGIGLLDDQDRSATRPPEGGSKMHSLIYFLLTPNPRDFWPPL
jgi:hypothetical protein